MLLLLPILNPTNKKSNFVQAMEHEESVAGGNRTCFTGSSIDGVSFKIEYVQRIIFVFIYCNTDHVGLTDTNHNTKYWKYYIIGGSCGIKIGTCVIAANILLLAGIYADPWRLIDFASDLLVLKLASHKAVKSLNE